MGLVNDQCVIVGGLHGTTGADTNTGLPGGSILDVHGDEVATERDASTPEAVGFPGPSWAGQWV